MDDWNTALAEQAAADAPEAPAGAGARDAAPGTSRYEKPAFDATASGGAPGSPEQKLDMVLDIPVTVSMEVGRGRVSIRNLLQLSQGSIVELDRLAGEPMDVLVNGTLVAQGEVVVVNDKYGIRLTDVISPAERIRRLR